MRRSWKALVLASLVAALVFPAFTAASGGPDWKTTTFDSFLYPQVDPCDGSTVPMRTGTTSLAVAVQPSGRALVRVDVDVAGDEYVTAALHEVRFDAPEEETFTFVGRSVTLRDGQPTFITRELHTVYVMAGQPFRHRIDGLGSHCILPEA